MAEVSVREFADVVGVGVDRLLAQLREAGVEKSAAEDVISDEEKAALLEHLRKRHGKEQEEAQRITLKRKSVGELKVSGGAAGKRTRTRTKTVNVEYRKVRTYVKKSVVAEKEAERLAALKAEEERKAALQREEEERRQREREEAERRQREAEEKARAEEEARRQAEEQLRQAEEQARLQAEEQRRKAEQARAAREAPAPSRDDRKTRYGRKELHVSSKPGASRRKKRAVSGKVVRTGATRHGFEKPTTPIVRTVEIPESITVAELAQKMSVKAAEVIKALMNLGTMATINQALDQETAAIVVEEMGHKAELIKENALEEQILETAAEPEGDAVTRPPVVTIMGHVDHGKTSLLDHIRESRVAAREAGGITQHIGAYHVETDHGTITFLDTPGHAAFSAMRARGAGVTDIVILVVAADDGVKPQTLEAIQHARAAGVPIIVAVNKVDKPEADPERVRNELAQHDVIPEDWGGDIQFVNVSAKTGEGIDQLLDAILLQAELQELKAVPKGPARGVVIESRLDKGRGPVATVLVQSGQLKQGDILLAGMEYGRVRALVDENGRNVKSAGPSIPVEVLGLSGVPRAGDEALVVPNERKARELAEFRRAKDREGKLARQQAAKLENLFKEMQAGETATLNVLVKADVQGSAEAIQQALEKLSTDEVKVAVVASGVGGITESDVNLASASRAIIIGFNVRADAGARRLAESEGIDIRYYSVIYDLIDDVKQAMSGLLTPELRETIIGVADVREVFRSSKFGHIAGCMVTSGVIRRNNPIRVLRDNVVIFEGELESLRHYKEDVQEVREGQECGIGVKGYKDIKPGDQIEVFERIEVERTL